MRNRFTFKVLSLFVLFMLSCQSLFSAAPKSEATLVPPSSTQTSSFTPTQLPPTETPSPTIMPSPTLTSNPTPTSVEKSCSKEWLEQEVYNAFLKVSGLDDTTPRPQTLAADVVFAYAEEVDGKCLAIGIPRGLEFGNAYSGSYAPALFGIFKQLETEKNGVTTARIAVKPSVKSINYWWYNYDKFPRDGVLVYLAFNFQDDKVAENVYEANPLPGPTPLAPAAYDANLCTVTVLQAEIDKVFGEGVFVVTSATVDESLGCVIAITTVYDITKRDWENGKMGIAFDAIVPGGILVTRYVLGAQNAWGTNTLWGEAKALKLQGIIFNAAHEGHENLYVQRITLRNLTTTPQSTPFYQTTTPTTTATP